MSWIFFFFSFLGSLLIFSSSFSQAIRNFTWYFLRTATLTSSRSLRTASSRQDQACEQLTRVKSCLCVAADHVWVPAGIKTRVQEWQFRGGPHTCINSVTVEPIWISQAQLPSIAVTLPVNNTTINSTSEKFEWVFAGLLVFFIIALNRHYPVLYKWCVTVYMCSVSWVRPAGGVIDMRTTTSGQHQTGLAAV